MASHSVDCCCTQCDLDGKKAKELYDRNAVPPRPAVEGKGLAGELKESARNQRANGFIAIPALMDRAAATIAALEAQLAEKDRIAKEHGNYILKLEDEAIALEAQLAEARKALATPGLSVESRLREVSRALETRLEAISHE